MDIDDIKAKPPQPEHLGTQNSRCTQGEGKNQSPNPGGARQTY